MVNVSDVLRLACLYPQGSLNDPTYAFAGGTAVLCWLCGTANDREHRDIDLVVFRQEFFNALAVDHIHDCFFLGGVVDNRIVPYYSSVRFEVQACWGSFYDSVIAPTKDDVRCVTIDETSLLVLSPEFTVVSKLSYPNVHRRCDFFDVLRLTQERRINDHDYLANLLRRTPVASLITPEDILSLRTDNDLNFLVDSIHRQLIRRFLYWDGVHVDALQPLQSFLLLDLDESIMKPNDDVEYLVDDVLRDTTLAWKDRHIVTIGLHLLCLGIPTQGFQKLIDSAFLRLLRRSVALATKQPTVWLSRCKIVFTTLRELARSDQIAGWPSGLIGDPALIRSVIERILLRDRSRFTLMAIVKTAVCDVEAGRMGISDCAAHLRRLLAG